MVIEYLLYVIACASWVVHSCDVTHFECLDGCLVYSHAYLPDERSAFVAKIFRDRFNWLEKYVLFYLGKWVGLLLVIKHKCYLEVIFWENEKGRKIRLTTEMQKMFYHILYKTGNNFTSGWNFWMFWTVLKRLRLGAKTRLWRRRRTPTGKGRKQRLKIEKQVVLE